ncbi:DUF4225 domain-containing protein [Morganella psychrotolerans]|uniref:DUF4225 domain-containing protein n=1 Tax=Morganella psychrotolerans TaxID=368603 RepID=A0A1B8GZJ0_9GAMM|nr:DUF4225 domain-containing protein [Morganella psychrotolerans]OBU02223.1 hypothetical protein AYY18_12630 [Morganella psychrotolerans]
MPTARVLSSQPAYSREFDDYCNKLKNLSERAATYLLQDPEVKSIYRENIRKAIAYLRDEFYRKRSSAEDYYTYREGRDNAFNGLLYLYESEDADYQRGRRNDWSVYEATKKFEESGFLYYGKKGGQILGGVFQTVGGYMTFKIGGVIRSNKLKGIGLLAISTGVSNTYEYGSALTYDITKGKLGEYDNNILQNTMADVAEYTGYSRRSGELVYKTVDFSISMFLSFGALVKLKDPRRILNLPVKTRSGVVYPSLLERWFGEKGGFFLFHALRSDFTFKVSQMSRPYFLYNTGMAVNKFSLLLSEYNND